MCKVVLFLLAALWLIRPSFAAEGVSQPTAMEGVSQPTWPEWSIGSAGYEIQWGIYKDGGYIAAIDFRDPGKSRLIISPDVAKEAKEIFEKYYETQLAQNLDEVRDEGENLLGKAQSLKRIAHSPVENDAALLNLMRGAPGLIWTGSGISLSSGIPTLPTFYKSLGLVGVPYLHMVEEKSLRAMNVEANQKLLFDFLSKVHEAAKLKLEPSPAHHAIKYLLEETQSHYATSNLDKLEKLLDYRETVTFDHENKALKILMFDKNNPYLERKTLPDPFIPSWILMVGLRTDDYGIATWAEANKIPIYYVGPNAPELTNAREILMPGNSNVSLRELSVQWIRDDAQVYMPALLAKLRIKSA